MEKAAWWVSGETVVADVDITVLAAGIHSRGAGAIVGYTWIRDEANCAWSSFRSQPTCSLMTQGRNKAGGEQIPFGKKQGWWWWAFAGLVATLSGTFIAAFWTYAGQAFEFPLASECAGRQYYTTQCRKQDTFPTRFSRQHIIWSHGYVLTVVCGCSDTFIVARMRPSKMQHGMVASWGVKSMAQDIFYVLVSRWYTESMKAYFSSEKAS